MEKFIQHSKGKAKIHKSFNTGGEIKEESIQNVQKGKMNHEEYKKIPRDFQKLVDQNANNYINLKVKKAAKHNSYFIGKIDQSLEIEKSF